MGGCFSSGRKQHHSKHDQHGSDDSAFSPSPTNASTLQPHVGPMIMVTGATPNASNADFTDYIDGADKAQEATSTSESSSVTDAEHAFVSGDGVHLRMADGQYITRNGKFIELRQDKSEDSEFLLINTDHQDFGTCLSIQTKSRELAFDILGTLENGVTSGRPISLEIPKEVTSQLWNLTTSGGYKTLHTVTDTNLVLEVINQGRLQIMPLSDGADTQHFVIE